MGLVGSVFLRTIADAGGTEILHVRKSELIEKIDNAAKRFVDSVYPSRSDSGKQKKKGGFHFIRKRKERSHYV